MDQAIQFTRPPRGHVNVTREAMPKGIRLKTIALPAEHGGWGFSLEPVALGLVVAPSLPGLCLALAALTAFLARHPLKMVMGDRRRGRRLRRTPIAERFALLYISVASLSLLAAMKTSTSYEFLLPLLLAAPGAFIQLFYDRASRSRALLPELAGATALASIAASIALAGGWTRGPALGLWAILAARVAPTILYVRARLKTFRGQRASTATVVTAHALAVLAALALVRVGLTSALSAGALLILLARALHGISRYDRAESAKQIGFRELGFGAVTVMAIALGYYLNV